MLQYFQSATNSFFRNAFSFIYSSFLHLLLSAISAGTVLAIVLIAFFVLSVGNLIEQYPIALAVVAALCMLLLIYLCSGLKGALIRAYFNASAGVSVTLFSFLSYATANAMRFFLLTLLKLALEIIIVALCWAIYSILLKALPNWVFYLLVLVFLIPLFIIEFIFTFAYISAAVKPTGVLHSLQQSIRLIAKTPLYALLFFTIYAVVFITYFIPLLNLFTFLIAFPIVYVALINLFQKV